MNATVQEPILATTTLLLDAVISIAKIGQVEQLFFVTPTIDEDQMDANIIAARRGEPLESLDDVVDELGLNE
ncbi:MAG TPA: hypothetical protein VF345_04420 [Chthoniobacterales bacterium]